MFLDFPKVQQARMNLDGSPKPQNRSTGIKWALLSTIAVLATAILAACTLSNVILAALSFASGAGVVAGIFSLGGAVITGLATTSLAMLSKQCILNAHHHLKKPVLKLA